MDQRWKALLVHRQFNLYCNDRNKGIMAIPTLVLDVTYFSLKICKVNCLINLHNPLLRNPSNRQLVKIKIRLWRTGRARSVLAIASDLSLKRAVQIF